MQNKPPEIADLRRGITESHRVRRTLARGFAEFCIIYLGHHFNLKPAVFHPELVRNLSDEKLRALLIVGFRGSAKSTFGSLALPLWAALEKPERYPFIITIADTANQAALNIANIKYELENNEQIKDDYGHIKNKKTQAANPEKTLESEEEWQAKNMLLDNGVRILARSRGQKMRGLKHRQHRPKLIVIDDPEDLEWVRTKENRDKSERWLLGEVLPAIDDKDGRWVAIGNHLHTDALLARIERRGIAKALKYPLLTSEGICQWQAKYPDTHALERKKTESGPIAWQREYLLKVVPDEGQEVTEEDLHYYDKQPQETELGLKATGVDPAISKKETADYTGMVTGISAIVEGQPRIYIQPQPINRRMDVRETLAQAKAIDQIHQGQHLFYVEAVAYQKALIELMINEGLAVEEIKPLTDKRARLKIAATYIKNGVVQFPRTGCEDLITQLLNFGIEEHDDMVDALVMTITGLAASQMTMPEVVLI